jgi:hypothetical protein
MQRDGTRTAWFFVHRKFGHNAFDGSAAHAAEFVSDAILVSTGGAEDDGNVIGKILRRIFGRVLGIGLGGEALCGFERGGDSIGAGLGTAHFRWLFFFVHEVILRLKARGVVVCCAMPEGIA